MKRTFLFSIILIVNIMILGANALSSPDPSVYSKNPYPGIIGAIIIFLTIIGSYFILDKISKIKVNALVCQSDIEGLIKAIDNPLTKLRAIEALGNMKDIRAITPLLKALNDKDYLIRSSAALALGKISDIDTVEPLSNALKDEYYGVRENAKIAIEMIENRECAAYFS